MHNTGISPAAAAYAQALLELASGNTSEDAAGEELAAIVQIFAAEPLFKSFISDPSISPHERWPAIKNSLQAHIAPLTLNFIGVVNENGRLPLLREIEQAYKQLLDQKHNRVRVQVTVAQPLNDEQLQQVQQRVSNSLGKHAMIEQKVDDAIIGGMVIRVQDKVIDASVRSQLDAMRKQLKTAAS